MTPKTAVVVCLLALASPLLASNSTENELEAPHMEALALLEDRLGLSEDQAAAAEPVLQQHHVEQQAVLERLRIDPNRSRSAPRPSRTELFELASALMPVWDQTNTAMADILSESQMEGFLRYQNEQRNQLRRRLQGRR